MMGGHLVFFTALLMKPHPGATALDEIILNPHRDSGTHASERVAHQGDEGPIPQAYHALRVDGFEEVSHLLLVEYRGFADFDDVLRAPDRCRGVHGHDLADDEPVKEHPESGESLLDRGAALSA